MKSHKRKEIQVCINVVFNDEWLQRGKQTHVLSIFSSSHESCFIKLSYLGEWRDIVTSLLLFWVISYLPRFLYQIKRSFEASFKYGRWLWVRTI
jgi:hypothetical protein